MSEPARVHVRGDGLLVTAATPGALAVTQRELVGIPLLESMHEERYKPVLEMIGRAVRTSVAGTDIVLAPNHQLGRVVADPIDGGACVTFLPVKEAVGDLHGPDLLLGEANDVWQVLANRTWRGLSAREAFPEPVWEPVRDVMHWVMAHGAAVAVPMPSGWMSIVRTGRLRLTTVYHGHGHAPGLCPRRVPRRRAAVWCAHRL
jgi:hypothetical protein